MSVTNWIKHEVIDRFGIDAVLSAVQTFGASAAGQEKIVRSVGNIALAVNDLSRGEITAEEAKGFIMGAVPDLLPLEYLASFSQSEVGQKNVVKGVQGVVSGVIGMMLGTDARERAKEQMADGIELLFFVPSVPPAPPVEPTPPQA